MEGFYYTYILLSRKDNKFYIGFSPTTLSAESRNINAVRIYPPKNDYL